MSKNEIKIRLSLPANGYRRWMFFNRFAIQRIGNHALVHFALMDGSGILRDHYVCLLSEQTLRQSREELSKYLGRVGAPKTSAPMWSPPATGPTDTANVIFMGQGDEAEIVLAAFAAWPAVGQAKTSELEIPVDGIACLRCDVETQRQFLAALLADN